MLSYCRCYCSSYKSLSNNKYWGTLSISTRWCWSGLRTKAPHFWLMTIWWVFNTLWLPWPAALCNHWMYVLLLYLDHRAKGLFRGENCNVRGGFCLDFVHKPVNQTALCCTGLGLWGQHAENMLGETWDRARGGQWSIVHVSARYRALPVLSVPEGGVVPR